MLLTTTVMVVSLIFGKPWNDWPGHALCPMAPDYRTVPDYRHLQLICERQAVVSVSNEARRALQEMAEEYRKMAEFLERKLQEQQRH
jgi:hypothetical protein